MRKHLIALAVALMLLAAIPMQAFAAGGITIIHEKSTQKIVKGDTGTITLSVESVFPTERVAYKIKDSDGDLVSSGAEDKVETISGNSTRIETISLSTSSLSVGKYTAECRIQYENANGWFDAAGVGIKTFSFEVIKDECGGNHDTKVTVHQEVTCEQDGIEYHACKNCDYVGYVVIKATHNYDDGESIKKPTATKVGQWKYTCKTCGSGLEVDIDTKYAATITTQPKKKSAYDGEKATVSVKATGNKLTYTWQYSTDDGATWKNTSSDTGRKSTYSLTMNEARDGRLVRCRLRTTFKSGDKTQYYYYYTDAVKLTTKYKAKITTQPKKASAFSGEKATTTIKATGDGLKYQWYYKNPGSSSYKKSSITTAKCSVTMKASRDGRKMYCVVTDEYGNSVKSDVITLTMKKTAQITTNPSNKSGYTGDTMKFTVKATGDGLKYQWQYSTDGGAAWKEANSTKSTYSPKMQAKYNGRLVRCVVTDKYGNSKTSKSAKMTLAKVKITSEPENEKKNPGERAIFDVKAKGEGLKYQWYYKDAGSDSWKKASSTKSGYYPVVKKEHDGRKFRCVVTDKYGNKDTSNTVKLTLK